MQRQHGNVKGISKRAVIWRWERKLLAENCRGSARLLAAKVCVIPRCSGIASSVGTALSRHRQ